LKVFAKTFAFVGIRRIVDYENMPLLTKEAGGVQMNFAMAVRYIAMFAGIRASRFLRSLRDNAELRSLQNRRCSTGSELMELRA